MESGKSLGEPLRGHEGKVSSVAVSGDGRVTFSGSTDYTVRVWNNEIGSCTGVVSHKTSYRLNASELLSITFGRAGNNGDGEGFESENAGLRVF